MSSEPLIFIQIGGMALVQAIMGLVQAFGVPLTVPQVTAINGFATIVLTILARMKVTPTPPPPIAPPVTPPTQPPQP